jgi:two-component system nitrogen regulation response regulator GlnG/two-component system response regulator HydG
VLVDVGTADHLEHVTMANAGDLDSSTLPPTNLSGVGAASNGAEAPALVVLWSRHEPARLGEILVVPAGDPEPWTLGRRDARAVDRRLLPVRQRPGRLESGGPLECPRISRTQLRLTATPAGLLVENVGSCPLLHGGVEVTRAEIAPGDLIELRNEMLFLCVRRAPIPVGPSGGLVGPLHPFGQADASGLVGESPAMWDLRHRLEATARHGVHVLILGASGTGKELVARALHAGSSRSHRSMVSRNAATLPEGLVDAELFGNVRGYPNPGMPERPGLVGEAHESTLFLDELAELPQGLQAHLLRVMDEGEYQRLGEATSRRADLRIVAATNRPEHELKHDVLARLKIRLKLPGLDARREDIPLLVVHLLRQHGRADARLAERLFPGGDPGGFPRVSPALLGALVQHRYTTHVRELETLLLRAALEGDGKYLELTPELRRALEITRPAAPPAGMSEAFTADERARLALLRKHGFRPTACGRDPAYPGNRQTADLHLRQLLCRALQLGDWDPARAAALLAADGDPAQRDKVRARLDAFVGNLRARLATEPDDERARRSLAAEWKGSADAVLQVVDALRAGKMADSAG